MLDDGGGRLQKPVKIDMLDWNVIDFFSPIFYSFFEHLLILSWCLGNDKQVLLVKQKLLVVLNVIQVKSCLQSTKDFIQFKLITYLFLEKTIVDY